MCVVTCEKVKQDRRLTRLTFIQAYQCTLRENASKIVILIHRKMFAF